MGWPWSDVRKAIDDSDGQFPAFLGKLPRCEIERLMWSNNHWCNVVGVFDIENGQAAKALYDEIVQRAKYGKS